MKDRAQECADAFKPFLEFSAERIYGELKDAMTALRKIAYHPHCEDETLRRGWRPIVREFERGTNALRISHERRYRKLSASKSSMTTLRATVSE